MIVGLLFATLVSQPVAGQGTPWRDPGGPAIDSIFARFDRTSSPGCALGVFGGGRILYTRGYGMADLNQGIAIQPGTAFYIASTSKQFAAASIALAAEMGRINLDDPITRYLPELPPYAERITIRHLVHHTSGIRDYLSLWGMSGRSFADEIPEDVALDLISRQLAADFAAGSKWSYSNSGYFLLGVVIKRATGMSLRDFSQRHMFGPLGMTDTHWHDDNKLIVPRRAEGYQPNANGYEIVKTSFAAVGDGGLYTTVLDLAKWDDNFFGNRLGTRGQGLIDELTTPGTIQNGTSHGYGFGLFMRTYRGQPVVDHGGSFIGYRAQLMRFPSLRFSVAILCNDYTAQPERMAEQVADLYLADRLGPKDAAGEVAKVAVAPAILDRYVGRYEVATGQILTVLRKGDRLEGAVFGMTLPLTPVSDSEFVAPPLSGRLVFRAAPDGVTLTPTGLGGEPVKQLGPAPVLDGDALRGYAGRFTSEELDSWITVSTIDTGLWLRARYDVWTLMEPIGPDVFVARGSRLDFLRNPKGAVVGFRLSSGRSANLEFVRTVRPLRRAQFDRPGPPATGDRR
ncbi:MAG: serine hydrolase [Gemmatimonadales bacterium]